MNRNRLRVIVLLSLFAWSAAHALGVSNYEGADAAIVHAHMAGHGFGKWDGFTFASVDGQRVSGLRHQDSYFTKFRLSPGNHRIGVLYQSPDHILREFAAVVLLDVTLKAGGSYQLNGTRTGNRLRAWVEEVDTHNIVSRLVSDSGAMRNQDDGSSSNPDNAVGGTSAPAQPPKPDSSNARQ